MYKVNDIVYVYIRGTKKESFALHGLHGSRFGIIKNITQTDNDNIKYEVELAVSNAVAQIDNTTRFTFYDMNELVDCISSINIPTNIKEQYVALINDVVQDINSIENTTYKY